MKNGERIDKDSDRVGSMFDSIARRYDFLNHLLSFGIDRKWRKRTIEAIAGRFTTPLILDVATGTGDLAIAAAELRPGAVKGIDISEKMLDVGRKKIEDMGLSDLVEMIKCDSESICFPDNTFDVAMVAFGVRNFSDTQRGLSEIRRVLRNGGMVAVLEFSKPGGFPFRSLYSFYFRYLLPAFGGIFSRNRAAYSYLHRTVMDFPDGEDFLKLLREAGFSQAKQERLTLGIATIYTAVKDQIQ